MISVFAEQYGVVEVKPLGVIWGKYKQWNPKNTIMIWVNIFLTIWSNILIENLYQNIAKLDRKFRSKS